MNDVKRLLAEAVPLPWRVRRSIHGPEYRHVQLGKDENYTTLDLIPADARLIVYAVNRLPDYEALADAAKALLDEWDVFNPTGTQDTLDTRRNLRAALARLRGET